MNEDIRGGAGMLPYLIHLNRQLADLSPLAAAGRQLEEGATAAELELEVSYARELESRLADLYRYPLLEGVDNVPEGDREDIQDWIMDKFRETGIVAGLLLLLQNYGRLAFNLGGQIALDELGLAGTFNLTDPDILELIDAEAASRVDPDGPISLTRTTAAELAVKIDNERQQGNTGADLMSILFLWLQGRAAVRATAIAETETVRESRLGLLRGFIGNGIKSVIHKCEADVEEKCITRVCIPLCGKEYDLEGRGLDAIPSTQRIPLHPHCRCYYKPIRDNWTIPLIVWTGFAMGLLDD